MGFYHSLSPIGYNVSDAKQGFSLDTVTSDDHELYGNVLIDYQILGLISYYNYISSSHDLDYQKDRVYPTALYPSIRDLDAGSFCSTSITNPRHENTHLFHPRSGGLLGGYVDWRLEVDRP